MSFTYLYGDSVLPDERCQLIPDEIGILISRAVFADDKYILLQQNKSEYINQRMTEVCTI